MANFYESMPNVTDAYHLASDELDDYYGKAPKGKKTSDASWQIFRQHYTLSDKGKDWIMQYPVDPVTGKASDAPKFVWDDVETYTYRELGT